MDEESVHRLLNMKIPVFNLKKRNVSEHAGSETQDANVIIPAEFRTEFYKDDILSK